MSRISRAVVLLILITGLVTDAAPAFAETVELTLYGPEQFVRDTGSPETVTREFTVARPVAQSYVMQVVNGSMEGDSLVSSAVITLNGVVVFKQNDFGQGVYYLEEPVSAQGNNTLEVKLSSIPTSYITITIVGNYLPEDVDDDGDGYTENEGDCDDTDPVLNPDTVWLEDADNDGYTTGLTLTQCEQPTGYVLTADPGDCDDTDAVLNPDTVWLEDVDGDGYTTGTTLTQCEQPAGYVLIADPGDCDDTDPVLNPDTTWYEDADGDGYTTGTTLTQCEQPAGYILTATAGDCDDTDSAVNPGATEVCNEVDDDCDSQIDEGVTITFYLDTDADGYGLDTDTVQACSTPSGYADQAGDCDDGSSAINPGAAEVCNAVDDNCNSSVDEGFDTDGDGYTTCGGDCDDGSYDVNPGASEICDGIDNDCDGVTDPGCLTGITVDPESFTLTMSDPAQQLTVTGYYSDNTSADLTASSTGTSYASSDTSVATVSPEGLVTAVATGTATVTASNGGFDVQAQVTVQMLPADYVPQPEGSFGSLYEDLVPPDITLESYDERRFSVITGLVQDRYGGVVPGVTVTIHDHPEYGSVPTDQTGRFSIPVDGAETLVVQYEKENYLTLQRKVDVPWNDIAVVDTVTMIQPDIESTLVFFTGDPTQDPVVHQSSETVDEFGARSLHMVFTRDNRAYTYDADGYPSYHSTIRVSATEYPTPESMPGVLPPTSGFTYCVELESSVGDVMFEKPVVLYVDNFLGFDVGVPVPVGYYNRETAEWEPEPDGVVVRLLDTDSDGVVDALDYTGDDIPDDLDGSGSFTDEVIGLDDPAVYHPGDTYWRMEISHFSARDANWGIRRLTNLWDILADLFTAPFTDTCPSGDCDERIHSYVEQRSRVFNEDIPVPGTGMTLHYASDRNEGYKKIITVPVMGDTVPSELIRIIARVEVAGKVYEQVLDPLPNQKAVFEWDGLDFMGMPVKGSRTAKVKVGWVFRALYQTKAGYIYMRRSFGKPGDVGTGVFTRGEEPQWREWSLDIPSDPGGGIADGWTLSPHHRMDLSATDALYKGNGTIVDYPTLIFNTFLGGGTGGYGFVGIGGLATEAGPYEVKYIAADKDRNIYFTDYGFEVPDIWKRRVFRVGNDGIVTLIAGKVVGPAGGLGGPALDYVFSGLNGLAVGPDGLLYISERSRVLRIDADGIIDVYAGGGSPPDSIGDGGPATDAYLSGIRTIHVDRDGNLYIAEENYHRVRKVTPDGYIDTFAGTGASGFSGDGGLATSAKLAMLNDIASDNDGNVYFSSNWNNRVRKVTPDGIIDTVAGTGEEFDLVIGEASPYEGGPATSMPLSPTAVATDQFGNLYVTTVKPLTKVHTRVIKVDPGGTVTTVAGAGFGVPKGGAAIENKFGATGYFEVDDAGDMYLVYNKLITRIYPATDSSYSAETGGYFFAEDSGVGHVMDSSGLHERTVDLASGLDLLTFGYDSQDRLASITDRFSSATTIQRNGSGVPVSITSPDGIVTSLAVDTSGDLTRVTYPEGTFYDMTYTPDGLMTFETDPAGNTFEHIYDDAGRVTDVLDPAGGHWAFARTVLEDASVLMTIQTAEGDVTSYVDFNAGTGEFTSDITGKGGSTAAYRLSPDGLSGSRLNSCGTDIDFTYTLDLLYKYKEPKSTTVTMPSTLSVTTTSSRAYSDTDADETPDLITDTVTVNGKTSTVQNDVLSGTVTATSPTGRQVTSYYSPTTLLTSRTSTPGLYDTEFTYDARGRLETVSVGTRTTTFAYDGYGYLDYMTTPDGRTFDYTYDVMGRLTGEDRPDGGLVDYSYDDNGNVTAIVNPNDITHGFTYTANDQRESYNTPLSGSYVYEYDRDRRLKTVTYPSGAMITNTWGNGQLQSTSTPEGLISYTYDCGSKLESITKGGESSSYTYDGSLLLTDTRAGTINALIDYTYNTDLQVDSIGYAGDYESFTYDDDGLLTSAGPYTITRNLSNGLPLSVTDGTVTQGRDFSGYGEIDGVDYTVGATATYSWAVSRNNAGRITHKVENIGTDTITWDYTYDEMGRLETVYKDSMLAEAYSYDGQGNRLSETNTLRGVSRTYTNDIEDKIVYAGTDIYTYDVDGFLTSRSIESGAYSGAATFEYSSRGELLSVSLPTGNTITYDHDPMGRRIAKSVNGTVVEKYLWQDFTTLLAVYDGSDTLVQRFEYADGRMPVAMTYQGSVYYFGYDQVGSLRSVTDSTGNTVKRIDYDSFGNILSDSDPTFVVPFGFAGGIHDRDTGLVRFTARDYDPATGKWTAKDPIDFGGGDLNLLSYVGQDPVNFIDKLGLFVVYGGLGSSAGIGPPTDGSKINYMSISAIRYSGSSSQGYWERGVAGQVGAGRIGGVSLGVGIVGGINFGDVEDISGKGTSAGITILCVNFELTFDYETMKWTGFNVGVFKSIGLGVYGMETLTGRIPLVKIDAKVNSSEKTNEEGIPCE